MNITSIKSYIKRICSKIYEYIGNRIIELNYEVVVGDSVNYRKIPTNVNFIEEMHYLDEKDQLIQHMFGLQNLQGTQLNKYTIDNNQIHISTRQTNNENWLAFILDSGPEFFSFEFDYLQKATFCEFQIAFNYESLLNRNRFIIMENKDVLFDDISRGHFFTPLKSKGEKSHIFDNGRINHVEIVCKSNNYEIFVNHKSLMSVSVKKRLHRHNGLAIILWENYNNRNIDACLSNFRISKIEGYNGKIIKKI